MRKTLDERFWSKVEVTPSCWVWTGSCNQGGYGMLAKLKPDGGQTSVGAHRVAYQLLVGPIPDGLEIDHLCRVRNCVNPAHLEVVTRLENARRGAPANQTHCKRGHELTPENLNRDTGRRRCKICLQMYQTRSMRLRRKAIQTGERIDRLSIFDRDGWICQLCGQPIDPAIPVRFGGSACLDHVIPLRRGGAHTAANLQATHRSCNARKGRRLLGEESG
jgi:5-methylcytosine-specific restriction endonuclease McrA